MKISTILGALMLLSGSAFVAGEEPSTITITNLTIADEEGLLVCFNGGTGKLGKCRTEFDGITVNCDLGESINMALGAKATAAAYLQVLVSGTCNENLWLQRAYKTLLIGTDTGATIVGQSAGTATVGVGGSRVGLTNLTIINGESGPGVFVAPSGLLELRESVIQSSAGPALAVAAGTALITDGNTITATGAAFPAIMAREGAGVWVGNNNTISSAADAPNTDMTTINGTRGVVITLFGDGNQVTNTTGERALDLKQGSTFRQQNGHAVFNGRVSVYHMSNADFRDVEINGDVDVTLFGSLLLRDENSDGVATDTVIGTTTIGHLSNLEVRGTNVGLNGDLVCVGLVPGTVTGDPPLISGSDSCTP